MKLKVYYGTTAGVLVYIDGRKMTTEQATNELLTKGRVKVSKLDIDKNRPVGLFSSTGDFSIIDSSEPQKPGEIPLLYGERDYIAPIDYDTITPGDLKLHLESRVKSLREHIKESNIEIECVKENPPD
jgi:hypothetical protein